jgi:RNA polymerase sigma factor (sigma-70 family)
MNEDAELLNRYATDNSEAAFSELVRRYVDLVYSAALRLLNGDVHRAQDVTQQVFAELAGRAGQLRSHPALVGWLYTTTSLMSRSLVRAEQRRKTREQETTTMNDLLLETGPESDWTRLRAVLDDAMHELGEKDRLAVLLRYFQNKSLKEVGAALGLNENSARMRIERAVEKLRTQLARKGVISTASALAVLLTANSISAAPVPFVATLTSLSLASVATAAAGSSTSTLLKLMATTKLKTGVIGAIIITGIFAVILLQLSDDNSTSTPNQSRTSNSPNAMDEILARREASVTAANPTRRETNAIEATAGEIIATKLRQFGRSQRDLTHALAKHHGVDVPDDVERFFQAVERGIWEEIDAAHAVLLQSPDQLNQPRSPELHNIWRPIQEAWGASREAHNWDPDELLAYGKSVLGSLRPGMVYVGGTDPGAFIPTFLNSTSEGERHIVMTQNALADSTYLDYLSVLYKDRLTTPTHQDSEQTFQEYLADARKRYDHDRDFPDEPKQLRPGENVYLEDGRTQISGQVAVMAMNEKLFQLLMEKNPNLSFAMETSFPFESLYADATPLGPITELRVTDQQQALSPERATQTVDYWRNTSERLDAQSQSADVLYSQFAHAKMAMEHATLLQNRGYTAQAEQVFRLANEMASTPESLRRLVNLLKEQGRVNDAITMAERTLQQLPPENRLQQVFGGRRAFEAQFKATIDELKRLPH